MEIRPVPRIIEFELPPRPEICVRCMPEFPRHMSGDGMLPGFTKTHHSETRRKIQRTHFAALTSGLNLRLIRHAKEPFRN